jgi:hypothetical protein
VEEAVAGLLELAQRIRDRRATIEGGEGVTQEDRDRILADIDSLFRAGRGKAVLAERRRRKGLLLPLAANAIGAIVVVTVILLFSGRGQAAYGGVGRGSAVGLVTESRVIDELRRESAAALSEREGRISEIRAELERLALQGREARLVAVDPDAEKALRAELAALEGDSARRLADLARRRDQAAFFLDELRAVYSEARGLAAAGDVEAARAKAAAAGTLLAGAASATADDPGLSALLLEGNAALDAALAAAAATSGKVQPDEAGLLAARQSAKEAEARVAALEGQLAAARSALDGARRELAVKAAAGAPAQAPALGEAEARAASLEASLAGARRELSEAQAALAALGGAERARQEAGERLSAALARRDPGVQPLITVKAAPDSDSLAALLEAKVALRELAAGGSSLSANPALYGDLDRLFREIEAEGRRAGEASALKAAADALESLRLQVAAAAGRGGKPATATTATPEALAGPETGEAGEAADAYLARLDALLEELIAGLR